MGEQHSEVTFTAEQVQRLVSETILRIRMKSPFFATLMLYARFRADPHCPTCYTDGRDIYFNPEFIMKLPVRQRDGAFLHETLHAALSHCIRRGVRDPQIWNLAADVICNSIVSKQDYCELIAGAFTDEKLADLCVEEIYELLMKRYQEERQKAKNRSQNGQKAAEGQGKGKKQKGQQGKGSGKGQEPGEGEEGEGEGDIGQKAERFKENPCFGHGKPGEDPNSDGTLEDRLRRMAEMEAFWKQALRQAEIVQRTQQAGNMPAGWDRISKFIDQPQLNWRDHLWRFLVKTPTDFAGFDRRLIQMGYYLEQLDGESVQVYVCIDTSGSIDDKQLSLFMGELHGILGAYPHLKCFLFYADCALYGPYELEKGTEIEKPKGGGGTSFEPFFAKVKEMHTTMETGIAVYLTDGYGSFPEPKDVSVETLWVVTPGSLQSEKFPFGEVARLLED